MQVRPGQAMSERHRAEIFIWGCVVLFATGVGITQVGLAREHAVEMGWELHGEMDSIPRNQWALVEKEPAANLARPEQSVADLFIEALIQIESGGDAKAVGSAGERGLMQIKRETWLEMTEKVYGEAMSFDRAFEPVLNRRVGRAYLLELYQFLKEYRDQWNTDLRSLLAACYNAGPTRVKAGGFSPQHFPSTTRFYVERVGAMHDHYLEGNPSAVPSYAFRSVSRGNRHPEL